MYWIALKMLVGDKAKYYGSIAGVTFAALLIAQQTSIFCGLMLRTTSQIQDIADADVWVMDPAVQYVDELKPIKEDCLQEVRGVPGVAWAVHFYKGQARMKKMDGRYQQCLVLGLDDASFVGAPREIVAGSLADLRQPDAVIMDEAGYNYLWPGEPIRAGQNLRDERSPGHPGRRLQGVEDIFDLPDPVHALQPGPEFSPQERRWMSFVLVKVEDGASAERSLCRDHGPDQAAGPDPRAISAGGPSAIICGAPASRRISPSRSCSASSSAAPSPGRRFTASCWRTSTSSARSRPWA